VVSRGRYRRRSHRGRYHTGRQPAAAQYTARCPGAPPTLAAPAGAQSQTGQGHRDQPGPPLVAVRAPCRVAPPVRMPHRHQTIKDLRDVLCDLTRSTADSVCIQATEPGRTDPDRAGGVERVAACGGGRGPRLRKRSRRLLHLAGSRRVVADWRQDQGGAPAEGHLQARVTGADRSAAVSRRGVAPAIEGQSGIVFVGPAPQGRALSGWWEHRSTAATGDVGPRRGSAADGRPRCSPSCSPLSA
jgi:hypothetical protein